MVQVAVDVDNDPLLTIVFIIVIIVSVSGLSYKAGKPDLPPIVDHSEQYICVRDC